MLILRGVLSFDSNFKSFNVVFSHIFISYSNFSSVFMLKMFLSWLFLANFEYVLFMA